MASFRSVSGKRRIDVSAGSNGMVWVKIADGAEFREIGIHPTEAKAMAGALVLYAKEVQGR